MINNAVINRLIKDINISLCEFPRTNFPLEQKIQFGKSTTTGLRNSEVSVDNTQEAQTGPEEAWEDVLVDSQVYLRIDAMTRQWSYPNSTLSDSAYTASKPMW